RNAETGVSRSATISLQTGTNVPRRANSLNSSNDVIFIGAELRKTFLGSRVHDGGRRSNTGPPAKLLRCLGDEHLEAADRLTAGGGGLPQKARDLRIVNKVVDDAPTAARGPQRGTCAAVEVGVCNRRVVDARVHTNR